MSSYVTYVTKDTILHKEAPNRFAIMPQDMQLYLVQWS